MSEKKEKAYKLLAAQEKISHKKAKELIDRGVVYAEGRKIIVARGEIKIGTKFKIEKPAKAKVLFEDDNLIALDKPAFLTSEEIAKDFKQAKLLHRLDQQTSGLLLLAKNEEFRQKAIREFRKENVYKEYIAWIDGIVAEEMTIDKPILSIKGERAISKISKDGKPATTYIEPLMVVGHKSKVKVVIKSGRTHQIRVHLKSVGHPIIGDILYGGKSAKRIMLHARKIELLGYSFEAEEPLEMREFAKH